MGLLNRALAENVFQLRQELLREALALLQHLATD